ncbi:Protein CBG11400 [Caenorhabditis briggsae]|uniref:Protein CBG11400 n=1 Tax=Caenorhabditis briggsae TaxID=6238 RepID=A8XD42_CAEBR|nr:Protein CBG11400 [Caenorhabditis briggsae]CAP30561.2 Protein CBG11400 [Caenorhabditis briggsae]
MKTYIRLRENFLPSSANTLFFTVLLFFILLFVLSSNDPKKVLVVETETVTLEKVEVGHVWDTLDGIGYHFEENKKVVMDPRFEKLQKLPDCDLTVDKKLSRVDTLRLMDTFQKCINPIVERWRDNVDAKEDNIMVTLGVGHDTMAEEKLNRTLPNTYFYGADPIIEPNRQLYSAFGKFFPFAIGREPGFTKFRVLPNQNQKTSESRKIYLEKMVFLGTYEFQDVTTIPLTYFLSDILKLKRIDIAWIDIEGGEFEFLYQFYRGGLLDQKDITICQFNLEIHSKFHPLGAQVFHDFVFQILDDKRYVFLKPTRTEPGVHRMFFINLENLECVRKFLQ